MATFTFNCPQCGNLLSGEEEWRGMETQCPYCQKAIIIPVDKDYENSDIPQKTACRKKQILKILIPVVSICLIAVVVFLWSCNSSKSASTTPSDSKSASTTPSDVIKFMGIPIEGDIETFAKQLEAKGWKFEKKTPYQVDEMYGWIDNETWYFEDGKFWEFSGCHLEVKVLANSRMIYSVEVSQRNYFGSSTQELVEALSKIYGKFSKDHDFNRWDRQVGYNRIRVNESVYYYRVDINSQIPDLKVPTLKVPTLYITYANHLEKENERIKKEFSDEADRRRKAEREAKLRRASQNL